MIVREARENDLDGLLRLYTELNENSYPGLGMNVKKVWKDILSNKCQHMVVAEDGGRLVGTCEVFILPNLTQGQRPFAFVENVVVTSDSRRSGVGTALLGYARGLAVRSDCHCIMLMTRHKDAGTVAFYEGNGYGKDEKFGFTQHLL
jgi:ribosomal protein S18 acetylase RimI-like enzyme